MTGKPRPRSEQVAEPKVQGCLARLRDTFPDAMQAVAGQTSI